MDWIRGAESGIVEGGEQGENSRDWGQQGERTAARARG
jgi:hypothetical protein